MNRSNRYGLPFYSAVDYQILFFQTHVSKEIVGFNADKTPIEGDSYVSTTDTNRLLHKSPSTRELMDNIRNLKTWGLKVDVDQDIVFGKDGVLVSLIDKKYETLEQLVSDYPYVQELLNKGLELKIGTGIFEKSLYPGYEEYDTHVAKPKTKDIESNKNGLYCKNYKRFMIASENIRHTKNANIIRVACGLKPIYDSSQIKDNFKDYEDLDVYPEEIKGRNK
jgi:hypothetical protein